MEARRPTGEERLKKELEEKWRRRRRTGKEKEKIIKCQKERRTS